MRNPLLLLTLLLTCLAVTTLSTNADETAPAMPTPVRRTEPMTPRTPDVVVRYVDHAATGSGDGSSWANAFTHLGLALHSVAPGTHLWIAEGIYTPGTNRADSFSLKDGVSLFGGFPKGGGEGTFEARFPAAFQTFLSGEIGAPGITDNSYHVITGDATIVNGVVLDGLLIGGGNTVGAGAGENAGAGVFLNGSRVTLRDCTIHANVTDNIGPALAADDKADVVIDRCRIINNINTGEGSAVDIRFSYVEITNTRFGSNLSYIDIGPLRIVASESAIRNSVFDGNLNLSPSAGVITIQGGSSSISHVSVTNHNQVGLAVIPLDTVPGSAAVSNSIFWGNATPELVASGGSTLTVDSSIVQGGFAGGTNIINQDPLFVDAPNHDLTLQFASPAIDSGNPATCEPADLRGYPRPQSAGCDMGAYEEAISATVCATPNVIIPDPGAAGVNSSLFFPYSGTILDVDVTVNITHQLVGDLIISLTHDDTGTAQTLIDRPGIPATSPGCVGQNIDAVLDDGAELGMAENSCNAIPPAVAGRLLPNKPLAKFNGEPMAGGSTWTLNVSDPVPFYGGTLNQWCATITTTGGYYVTRTDDPPPNGCAINDCSLREAVIDANNERAGVHDTITFAVDGPFILSRTGADEDAAATGDLDITDSVTFVGNGTNNTIIDGGAIDRVFQVVNGANAIFSDLTIRNGKVDPVDGIDAGGGIDVTGNGTRVHLLRTIVRDNHALASGTGAGLAGGFFNGFGSTMIVEDSAIYGNSADSSGVILNQNGDLQLLNSTVYGNSSGDNSQAIYNLAIGRDANLTIRNSTLAGNGNQTVFYIDADPGDLSLVTLQNTIINGPGIHCVVAGDGTLTSLGNNIAGDGTCNLTHPADFPNTDPRLGPLTDNGGGTMTAALLVNSPALDKGNDLACPDHDQRGRRRIDRDGNNDGGLDNNPCDIGAFERQTPFDNTPPVADPQFVTVVKDTPKAITLTGSDADGDGLFFFVTTAPENGTLSGTAPALTYTPNAGFTGGDFFIFMVNDGRASSPEAMVTLFVTADPSGNTLPVANSQTVNTTQDTPVAIVLTGSDADGDSLTYAIVNQPQHGTLTGTAANRTYTPGAGFVGEDSFTFRVHDGTAHSATATITINVKENTSGPLMLLYLPAISR